MDYLSTTTPLNLLETSANTSYVTVAREDLLRPDAWRLLQHIAWRQSSLAYLGWYFNVLHVGRAR